MAVGNIFRENPASTCKVDNDLSVVCIVHLTIILLYDDYDNDDNDDDDDSSCPHAWQISLWPVQHLHTQYGSGSLFVVIIHLKQSAGHGCM